MKKEKIREVFNDIGIWLKTHKKQTLTAGIAAAALAAAAGISAYILQSAPVPADHTAAAQEAVSAVGSGNPDIRSESVFKQSPEPSAVPEKTETPAPRKNPGPSVIPEKTETPAPRKNPGPSVIPEKTETPVPENPEMTAVREEEEQAAAADPPEDHPEAASVHEHTWVPVTVTVHRDAVTHTVHHDAVTQTVHHDAVTHEEPVYEYRTICNSCGEDITGQIPDHIGPVCQGSYSVQQVQTGINIVTDKEAYDEETVVRNAWDEIVVDQEARDEVITAGYRCSTCGEMKES